MLYYYSAALAVILITALVTFFIIRKKNLATRENIINLLLCTVLAMVCATLTPLLANLMVKELYFSIFLSVVIAFILAVTLSFAAFLLFRRLSADRVDKAKPITEPASTVQAEELSQFGIITGLDSAAVLNEAAITSKVESPQSEENDLLIIEPDPIEISELIDRAMECKQHHNLYGAISFYEKAVGLNPDADLLTWIVVDLCSLYKKTNQKERAHRILQTIQDYMLNIKIKEDILQNL
jgi:phosphate/sulfate permease